MKRNVLAIDQVGTLMRKIGLDGEYADSSKTRSA